MAGELVGFCGSFGFIWTCNAVVFVVEFIRKVTGLGLRLGGLAAAVIGNVDLFTGVGLVGG